MVKNLDIDSEDLETGSDPRYLDYDFPNPPRPVSSEAELYDTPKAAKAHEQGVYDLPRRSPKSDAGTSPEPVLVPEPEVIVSPSPSLASDQHSETQFSETPSSVYSFPQSGTL